MKVRSVVFLCLLIVSSAAQARRGRRYNYTPTQQFIVHTQQIQQPTQQAARPTGQPSGSIWYLDYDAMAEHEASTELHWKLSSSALNNLRGKEFYAKVKYSKTRKSGVMLEQVVPATVDEQGYLTFILTGLDEGSVYLAHKVELFEENPETGKDNPDLKPVASIGMGVYGVTGAKTKELRARRGVVMRALKEAFAWANPRSARNNAGSYGVAQGNWCWKFYQFCAGRFSRADGWYIQGIHAEPSRIDGSRATRIARDGGPLHGDLLKGLSNGSSNHVGMILDIDPDTGTMLTIEGNVGNAVKIMERSPGSYINIGHISDSTVLLEE